MQSSRRKRERIENDHHGGGARRRHKPDSDESNGSHSEKVAENKSAEVSPHVDETDATTGQVQPIQDAHTAEGTNGGNDHSNAATAGLSAMDTSIEELQPQDSSLWQGAGKGTREEQISALIAHRKILLERMKQCKVAADSRLKRNDEKQKQQGGTNDAKNPAEGQSNTESGEIQRYRELCRKAVEANKKQRPPASEVEKRSSVSLRRGSSVGKRMSAAPPSLAPESSSLPPGDTSASFPDDVALPGVGSIPAAHLSMPNSKQAALRAAQQRPVKAASAIPQTYGSQQPQRKRSASASRGIPKSYPGSSSTSLAPGAPSMPLHAGTGPSGLPFNRLAYPTVNFPEARALREKRDGIRTKLNALIHERLERIQQTSNANKSDESGIDQLKSFPSLAEKPSLEEHRLALPRMVLERGVNSPSKLPRRRKTHWDYVLEEMRWLATDFVEERKWKAASARTLASAIVSNRLNAVAPVERTNEGEKEEEETPAPEEEEKKNESSGEDSETRVEVTAEMLEEIGARKYTHPSSSDTELVQSVARIMSDMIAEVWTGTIDCGLLARTDGPLISALVRHNKVRKGMQNREGASSSAETNDSGGNVSLQTGTEDNKENGKAGTNGDDDFKSSPTGEDQEESEKEEASSTPLSNDEISEKIDASTDRVESRNARRNRAKVPKEPVSLEADQRTAAEFVEFVWEGADSTAPCLDGPVASGKTVLSCSLIWKRRSEGPQLLVCSSSRMIRWAYEFERFTDLKLFIYGMRCGLSSTIPEAKAHSNFHSGDVVICDFSSLVQIEEGKGKTSLNLASFSTLVMDARFPTECLVEPDISFDNGTQVSRTSSADSLIPPELISHLWWATLLRSLRFCDTKRLLIDNSECRFLSESDFLGRSGLSERQRLDTTAAMTALVVGPDIFRCSEARSVQHKVVSWAKHCAKEGDVRKRPMYGEVRGVIVDASFPFRYVMDPGEGTEEEIANDWDVRLCSLSASQREAYEECCLGVRGALAFGSITDYSEGVQHPPESYQHAVQGLIKLRRVCAHSQIDDVLGRWSAILPTGSSIDDGVPAQYIKFESSASQPRVDIATDILSGSAKLRKLVTILRDECGFTVAEDAALTQGEAWPNKDARAKAGEKTATVRKKVAILAMLPEVQRLVSILLNAVGIRHQLLGSVPFLGREGNSDTSFSYGSVSESRFARNLDSALAWIDIQLSLLRFGFSPSEGESHCDAKVRTPCEIVIASPVLVGAENGGLGVEAADLVICLDEDWSGRDSDILERISKRCSFAHAMRKAESGEKNADGCSFVRLVCEKTCEHVFLSSQNGEDTPSAVDWPSDRQGLLYLPATLEAPNVPNAGDIKPDAENDLDGHFQFPALNVLRLRGKSLANVLLPTNPIPPDFATGDAIRFLPFQEWEGDSKRNTNLSNKLVRSLITEERRIQNARIVSVGGEAAIRASVNEQGIYAIPPFPSDFPNTVMSRHDMMAVPSRLYVDRTGRRFARMGGTSVHADSTPSRLAAPSLTSSSIAGNNGCVLDAWNKNGLSCKPGDLVPALLSYTTNDVPIWTGPKIDKEARVGADLVNGKAAPGAKAKDDQHIPLSVSSTARKNVFSAAYCTSREVVSNVMRDGNQGFEPLAYFPPLFPTLLSASDRAQADAARRAVDSGPISSAEFNMPNFMLERDGGQRKRKQPAVTYPVVASKRPRLGKVPTIAKAAQSSSTLPPPDRTTPSARHGSLVVASADGHNRRMDASIVTEDESSQWDQSSFHFDMGEDYGLLGVGALSSDIESSRHASMVSVDALGYARWVDPYEPDGLDHAIFSSTIPCDAEEIEAYVRGETDDSFLDTMLLFVAKRAPPGFGSMPGSSAASQLGGMTLPGAGSAWHPSRAAIPTPSVAAALSGADGTKKGKRKSQSQTGIPLGAFARVNPSDFSNRSMNPYGASSTLHSSKGRESYRSKILASILARQGGGRASLFQVPSFLLASIRIRDDVLRRVLGQSQELSGREVSYAGRQPWTRICYKMNSSTKQTGDSALRTSKNQQIKMLASPAPVDFGPFVAGYISSSYAACGAVPRSAVTGISLPMGVKISRRSGIQLTQGWTAVEDKKLKDSVLRYGLNWHLIAIAVDDVDKEVESNSSTDPTVFRTPSRSPSQCCDRWSRLVDLDPDLADELRDVERSRYSKATSRPPASNKIESENSCRRLVEDPDMETFSVSKVEDTISLVLPADMFVEEDGDEIMSDNDKQKTDKTKVLGKRSFAALRGAAKKKIEVILPIPGSVNGEKPGLVQSHPSHEQAVQAAIAGTSGGKPEMWPLQILDLADKHRAARKASGSSPNRHQAVGTAVQQGVQMRSPGRQHSSNRQPRPHASFQVPHGAMASPARNQGYPPTNTNGAPGPVRGASSGKPRSTK